LRFDELGLQCMTRILVYDVISLVHLISIDSKIASLLPVVLCLQLDRLYPILTIRQNR